MFRLKKVFFFKSLTIWKTQALIELQPQIENDSWHIHAINLSTKLCFIPLTSAPRAQLCGPWGVHIIPGTASGGPHKSPLRWGAKARFIILSSHKKTYFLSFTRWPSSAFLLLGRPLLALYTNIDKQLFISFHQHWRLALPGDAPALSQDSAAAAKYLSQERICFAWGILSSGSNLIDFTALEK